MRLPIKLRPAEEPNAKTALSRIVSFAEGSFKLATWCVLTATVKFFADKSGDLSLLIAAGILNMVLLLYIYGLILFTVELDIIPKEKRIRWWHHVVDLGVNVAITFLVWSGSNIFVARLIEAISKLKGLQ
jgi:hypothetical protein